MIVFTILGILVFWWGMGCMGFCFGMYLDARRGLVQFTEQVKQPLQEIETLIYALTMFNKKGLPS